MRALGREPGLTTVYSYRSDLWLAFDVTGEGRNPIVLVHGFASDRQDNWHATGWSRALAQAGHRVIALDCRGHGESDKPHAPAAYAIEHLVGDVLDVMTYANVRSAHLMGYSMGASIALHLLARHPERFRSAVLAGAGDGVLEGWRTTDPEKIAAGLLAKDPATIEDPAARAFRVFADRRRNDRAALAACMRRPRAPVDAAALGAVAIPVLVVVGAQDTLALPADRLGAAFPRGRLEIVPGDHLGAVAQPRFKELVLEFLAEAKSAARQARGG
jgi:pimeloyl-ACP methyl ester carboxylesterase